MCMYACVCVAINRPLLVVYNLIVFESFCSFICCYAAFPESAFMALNLLLFQFGFFTIKLTELTELPESDFRFN